MEDRVRTLSRAVEQSPSIVLITNPDGAIEYVNPKFTEVTGYGADEVVGRNPRLLKSGVAPEPDYRTLWETILTGREWRGEFRNRRKSGELFRALCSISPILDEAGRITHFVAVSEDITGRMLAERRLSEAMAFNATLLGSAPVGIITYRPDGRCLSCNAAGARIVGGTTAQIMELNFRNLESWRRSGLFDLAERTIDTRQVQEAEVHVRTTFGQVRWLSAHLSIFDAGGEDILLLVIADITARRGAQEASRRLAAILDATPDFVAMGDLKGRVDYLNAAGRRVLGLTQDDDLAALHVADGHPDWARRQTIEVGIPAALRDGSWQGLTTLRDAEGREIPFSQVILSHPGPDGQIAYLSTIMRDLREQRSLEAQLQQSQKLEAVGRLAGGVAHDFNNLLAVITGYGELMRAQIPDGHPARPRLEEVVRAAERASGLTRQLLAFSRKQVMQPKILDLGRVVDDVKRMLDRVVGEDVDIDVRAAAGLGAVKADPTQIEQVILNLVVNARDAMPDGGRLTIETANATIDEGQAASRPPAMPGRFVMLAVSDTGTGMDEETQKRIFEPFFTTKPEGQGTGLGLATVYGIVKQSGGYVWVYSEPGRGTTFKVYLPRVDQAETAADPAAAAFDDPRGNETVLVVEDMGAVREMIRTVLDERGYTVLSAADGEEAMALVRNYRGPIHLLLTDVVMPRMGGRHLAEQVQTFHPGIPVLYMSGYTDGAVTRGGELAEGVHLLEKPFSPVRLAQAVRRSLHPAIRDESR